MTATATDPPSASIRPRGLAINACAFAFGIAAIPVGAVVASGILPAGTAAFVLAGFGVSAASGAAGLFILTHLATVPHGDDRAAQLYLTGLVGHFLMQLLAVGLGLLAVFWIDEKFQSMAAFGVAFAATATLFQTVGSVRISRSLRARARSLASPGGDAPPPEPVDSNTENRDPGTP